MVLSMKVAILAFIVLILSPIQTLCEEKVSPSLAELTSSHATQSVETHQNKLTTTITTEATTANNNNLESPTKLSSTSTVRRILLTNQQPLPEQSPSFSTTATTTTITTTTITTVTTLPTNITGCMDEKANNYFAGSTIPGPCEFPKALRGCIDIAATNYNMYATDDDGSCQYAPGVFSTDRSWCGVPPTPLHDQFSKTCQCSLGGLYVPYGKFCSKGYTGCLGEQPCDEMDRCCQIHDWCVGQKGFVECFCNVRLRQCLVEAMRSNNPGFCGQMKAAAAHVVAELDAFEMCPCSNLDDTDCLQCTALDCHWCQAEKKCHSRWNPQAICDAWSRTSQGCNAVNVTAA